MSVKQLRFSAIRYVISLLCVALALKGTLLIAPLVTRAPFGLFYAAIASAAWLGGFGPGLFAILLAVGALYIFVLLPAYPASILTLEDLISILVFTVVATLLCYLIVTRRRAEQVLKLKEAEFINVLESISDTFLIVDKDWHVRYLNQYMNGYQGRTINQIIGSDLWEVYPQLCGTRFEEACQDAMAKGTATHFRADEVVFGRRRDIHIYPSEYGVCILCTADVEAAAEPAVTNR
jgi:K+-sensing histidine kinase KdpD